MRKVVACVMMRFSNIRLLGQIWLKVEHLRIVDVFAAQSPPPKKTRFYSIHVTLNDPINQENGHCHRKETSLQV